MTETTGLIQKLTATAFSASPEQLERALHALELKVPHRDMITAKQAAPILQVCPETVKRYGRKGILHPVKITQRKMRFDRAEVEQLAMCGNA